MGRDWNLDRSEDEENPYGGFGNESRSEQSFKKSSRRSVRRTGRSSSAGIPSGIARDSGVAPKGYRQEVWDLALLFEQKAEEESYELRVRIPIIYSMIEKRMGQTDRSAKVVRKMINLFWWDEVILDGSKDPIDQFTGVNMWNDLYNELVRRAQFKSAALKMDEAKSDTERPVKVRKHPPRPRPGGFWDRTRDGMTAKELSESVRQRIEERRNKS